MSKATYQTDCRLCNRTIRVEFDVDTQYVDENPGKRIRCAGCNTTNFIPRAEGIA